MFFIRYVGLMKKKVASVEGWMMIDDDEDLSYSRNGARLNIKDEKICFFFFVLKWGEGGGASKTPPSKISRRFWGGDSGFVQIIIGGFFLGAKGVSCLWPD